MVARQTKECHICKSHTYNRDIFESIIITIVGHMQAIEERREKTYTQKLTALNSDIHI